MSEASLIKLTGGVDSAAPVDTHVYGFVSIEIEPAKFYPEEFTPSVCEMVRYDQFVRALFKKEDFALMAHHAKGGCCEEAGELSDAIKRHVTYGYSLDKIMEPQTGQTLRGRIIEELGDLRFYMQAVANLYGISEPEILQANADKLSKRYKGLKYSNTAAQERADKNGVKE